MISPIHSLAVLLLIGAIAVPQIAAAQGEEGFGVDFGRELGDLPVGPEDDGDGDRHAGYYHPPVGSEELYPSRAPRLAGTDRTRRIGFVTLLTQAQLARGYAPDYALYAKGEEAEKLILVALVEGRLNTLFRMRSFLAQLTAVARTSPMFVEEDVADWYTFLDLLHMLGFEQLTVSDGRAWAHRYHLR
jgi:hypothetical protein